MEGFVTTMIHGLCQSSYYINLLGLKLPLALVVRASRARLVLALLLFTFVPFLAYCHVVLLPLVRESSYGLYIWHGLMAVWVTIPLLVVGTVILNFVRSTKPLVMLSSALIGTAALHWYALPAIHASWLGSVLLQVLFTFFEDGSTAGWIWCLYHVVQLQNYVRGQRVEFPERDQANSVLIIGNAPSVLEGEPLGAKIDQFTDVVRFNGYNIKEQEHTGSKVTYHFCNGRNTPSNCTIKAALPLFNASLTHACYLFMPHMIDATEIREKLMSVKVDTWFIEEERILALCKKIKCCFWQIPSSGMVAIEEFMLKYQKVTLHGFTFFEGKKIHYFEESPLQLITSWLERFVTHNPPQEKKWVQSLLKEGRAAFLAQDNAVAMATEQNNKTSPCKSEDKLGDGGARRRLPGLSRLLAMDGLPSQFSL